MTSRESLNQPQSPQSDPPPAQSAAVSPTMIPFIWNVVLAIAWGVASGRMTLGNLALGFALGYIILYFLRDVIGGEEYAFKARKAVALVMFFIWEVIVSNVRLAIDVATPPLSVTPAIVAVPLDARTDLELVLLTSMITLTPGNLSLDLSEDRTVLYVHCMYADDVERMRWRIKETFERRLLEVTR
jgi:multicomponent Na+:H+ antiporter subunit E